MMLARDRVDRELEMLLGRPLDRALQFDVGMDLTTSAAAAWMQTVELVEREASRPNGLTLFPLAAAHLEGLVIDGLLLAQPHNYSDALAAEPVPAGLGLCGRLWSSSRSSPTGHGRPPVSRRGSASARGPCEGSRA